MQALKQLTAPGRQRSQAQVPFGHSALPSSANRILASAKAKGRAADSEVPKQTKKRRRKQFEDAKAAQAPPAPEAARPPEVIVAPEDIYMSPGFSTAAECDAQWRQQGEDVDVEPDTAEKASTARQSDKTNRPFSRHWDSAQPDTAAHDGDDWWNHLQEPEELNNTMDSDVMDDFLREMEGTGGVQDMDREGLDNALQAFEDYFPELDPQQEALLEQKSQVILELQNAGDKIEEVIARHRHEIDNDLLEMVQRRLDASVRMEEGEIEREGWGLLLARLASELQRMEATPAELLLDQAMRTMLPQASKLFDRRREETRALLQQAFTLPDARQDVFRMVAGLAEGDAKKEDEDQPASQFVAKDQFLREARQLIMAAEDNIAEVQAALRSGEARGHEAVVHDFIKDRRNSIELVLQVIQVADEVEAGYKVMQHR